MTNNVLTEYYFSDGNKIILLDRLGMDVVVKQNWPRLKSFPRTIVLIHSASNHRYIDEV